MWWLEFRWLSPIDVLVQHRNVHIQPAEDEANGSVSEYFTLHMLLLMYYCPIPKKCGQVTSIQIQVCIKSLALYGENYGRGLKIWFFVTLTKLVTARLHKRSSSTFGNLDRMLDWIYIEFAMVIHFWVLHLVLVRRWESVKAPVVKAGTKRKREKKRKREILMLREQWNPQPTCI